MQVVGQIDLKPGHTSNYTPRQPERTRRQVTRFDDLAGELALASNEIYRIRTPEIARLITSCWICSVPSKMSKILPDCPASVVPSR